MLNVTKELTALARKLGYTGKTPDTVAKAINAITSVAGEGGGSGGGCDCDPGYEVVETQLFSETVTTVDGVETAAHAYFAYDLQINSPSLIVTFNDTDYHCTANNMDGIFMYGEFGETGPDFTNYPFTIVSSIDVGESVVSIDGKNEIYTEVPGTYSIAVSEEIVVVSNDFANAVNASVPVLQIVEEQTTWQEVYDAVAAKKLAFVCKKIDDDLFCEPVLFVSGSEYELTTMKSDGTQFETITYEADTADGPISAK